MDENTQEIKKSLNEVSKGISNSLGPVSLFLLFSVIAQCSLGISINKVNNTLRNQVDATREQTHAIQEQTRVIERNGYTRHTP